MEDRIIELEKRVKQLEETILDLVKNQNKTVAILDEFMDKCSSNFIEIQRVFDQVKK
jgi:hypothetical protein